MKRVAVLTISSLIFFSGAVFAQNIEYIGSTLWKDVQDIHIQGDYAYCVFRHGMVILDISDPLNPEFVSKAYLEGKGLSIFVVGNYAYFAYSFGIRIFDISDPANPVYLGNYDMNFNPIDIFVDGDYAYIAESLGGLGGLRIIDISDPSNPAFVADYSTVIPPDGIFVSGNSIYAVGTRQLMPYVYEYSFEVIDVSNPADPSTIGIYQDWGIASDLFVQDSYAYVCGVSPGIKIFDISDPSNPMYIGGGLNEGVDIIVQEAYAYMCSGTGGMNVINISDPEVPIVIGNYDTPFSASGIHILNNLAFIADGRIGGVEIVDIDDPSDPTLVGRYEVLCLVHDSFTLSDFTYVANGSSGLSILDSSDPTDPQLVGGYLLERDAIQVQVVDEYAYVAGYPDISILDVSDPSMPVYAGNLNTTGHPCYCIDGSYLFLAEGEAGLQIFDISDPTVPTLVGDYQTPGLAIYVHVSGGYAYVIDDYQFEFRPTDLYIIDVSDPQNPVLAGIYDSLWRTSVYVQGDYAYTCSEYNAELYILDISEPSNPFFVGSYWYDNHGGVKDLQALENYLYIAHLSNSGRGIKVIDIANPYSPSLAASHNTSGYVVNVHVTHEYIYLSEYYSMIILRFDPETGIIEEISEIPRIFSLAPNYPNPFNASTTISYSLPDESQVTISIYNLLGQRVATILEGIQQGGEHTITWDAADFPSGVYFARLEAGEHSENIKMVLLK